MYSGGGKMPDDARGVLYRGTSSTSSSLSDGDRVLRLRLPIAGYLSPIRALTPVGVVGSISPLAQYATMRASLKTCFALLPIVERGVAHKIHPDEARLDCLEYEAGDGVLEHNDEGI